MEFELLKFQEKITIGWGRGSRIRKNYFFTDNTEEILRLPENYELLFTGYGVQEFEKNYELHKHVMGVVDEFTELRNFETFSKERHHP